MNVEPYLNNVSKSFHRFAKAIETDSPVAVHSLTVVGSVLTPDYVAGRSDINSVIVAEEKSMELLDFLVELGREYREERVAPPLVMTREYIAASLDVFPIEFYTFREIHHTLFGEDPMADLSIEPSHLRLQCEREIKSRLLWLGQIYLERLGDMDKLRRALADSLTGAIPLFRAILALLDQEVALDGQGVVTRLARTLSLDETILTQLLRLKQNPDDDVDHDLLRSCFRDYYLLIGELGRHVDQMVV